MSTSSGAKGETVAGRQKMISEMAIGEEGFCGQKALYGGPARPVWGQGAWKSGTPLTTRTFLWDSPVFPTPSKQATLHVKREMMGFYVRFSDGAPTIKFRANHPPIPLPVIGANPDSPE
jgi:hypothetical protein